MPSRLLPDYPEPIAASRFLADAEDWQVVFYPGPPNAHVAGWAAVAGGGEVRYAAANPADAFFSAPAAFTGSRSAAAGGALALTLFAPSPTRTPSNRNVVLVGAAVAVGLDVVTGSAHCTLDPDGTARVVAPLAAGAGWVNLATGARATAAELDAVLADLRQLLVSGNSLVPRGGRGAGLRAAELYADPRRVLTLTPALVYQNRRLTATWPASPYAAAYRVRVSDGQGRTLYTAEVPADPSPSANLDSGDFHPAAGRPYTVTVAVLGPPAEQTVTPVDLDAPAVQVAGTATGADLTWAPLTDGGTYDVLVNQPPDGDPIFRRYDLAAPPLRLAPTDGLRAGVGYQASVRVRKGVSVSDWSRAVDFQLLTPRAVLAQLRERLLTNRPFANSVTLDDTTLPAGAPGQPDRVQRVLSAATASPRLTITTAAEPALTDDSLAVQGTAALWGDDAVSVTAVFTTNPQLQLEVMLRAPMPAGWMLGHGFEDLADSAFATLPLSQAEWYVTSVAQRYPGVFFELQPGLNLLAVARVAPDLRLLPPGPPPAGSIAVLFGGPVQTTPRVTFRFQGNGVVPDLTVKPLGRAALVFREGRAELTRVAHEAGVTDSLTLVGRIALAGGTPAATLTLPTLAAPSPTLTVPGGAPALGRLDAAVAEIQGALTPARFFPASLLGLAGLRVQKLGFTWDPNGLGATTGFLVAGSSEPWKFAGDLLTVSGVTVELNVVQSGVGLAAPEVSFAGGVTGKLAINQQQPLDVRVALTANRRWFVEIADATGRLSLDALAGFLSGTPAGLTPPLPGTLAAATNFAPSRAFLGGDPFEQTLDLAGFRLAQSRDWEPFPHVKVGGWAVEVVARKADGAWSATGRLEGNVTLGAGTDAPTFEIGMSVPPAPGEDWRIELAEGSSVRIPTVRQLLDLTGRTDVPLPDGIATLGGLNVTRLVLSFDPAAPALRHVGFQFDQSGQWVIIPGPDAARPALAASKVAAGLSVVTGAGGTKTLGFAGGVVTVLGEPVDLSVQKPDFDSDWSFRAAWDHPIRVPGLASLAPWMSPDGTQSALAAVPLFGSGFTLSRLALRFAGGTGALNQVAFRLATAELWRIAGDRLKIADAYADLEVPYPVSAAAVTGTFGGTIVVAGARVLVTGSKPAAGAPWALSGTLFEPATIRFLDAANQAADPPLVLPADLGQRGLAPDSLTVEVAEVTAVPQTGAFSLNVELGFDWAVDFGVARLDLRRLKGRIDKADTAGPLVARVEGELSFATLDVRLALQLGTQDTDTLVAGSVTDAGALRLGTLADGVSGATGPAQWSQFVPDGLPTALSGVTAGVNVTKGVFLLSATLAKFGWAYFLCRRGAPAGGGRAAEPSEYLFAAGLGDDFRFGNLLPGLAAADAVLTVQEARLAVYSVGVRGLAGLKPALDQLTGLTNATLAWPAPDDAPAPLPPARGVLLTARIRIQPTQLFGRVVEIGDMGKDPQLSLAAVLDRADAKQSLFAARLPKITVLSTLEFDGVAVTFRPAKNDELTVTGDVVILNVFQKNYRFHGGLTLNAKEMTGTLSLLPTSKERDVPTPFGIPGFLVEQLEAEVRYTFKTDGPPATPTRSRFGLVGKVRVGRPPATGADDSRTLVRARLGLEQGRPALFSLALDNELDVGDFLAQCVTGRGAAWPANFVNIVFKRGSRVYYYSADADKPAKNWETDPDTGDKFQDGFNVDAHFDLTLVGTVAVRGTLKVVEKDGHYAGIVAHVGLEEPVDLVFIELAGSTLKDGKYVKGPTLDVVTAGGFQFGFSAGVNFLGKGLLSTSVLVRKAGGTVVSGHVDAPTGLASPFDHLTFDFIYSVQTNSFQVLGWPAFSWLKDIINVVEEIRGAAAKAESKGCGALVGLLLDNTLRTGYRVSPAANSAGADLAFSLTVSCDMSVVGVATPFLTCDLPAITVRVPKDTRLADLPEKLAAGIAAAGPAFVGDLLKDPEKIAKVLAMTFGQSGVEIASDLLCRGLVDAAVPAAVGAAAEAIATAGGATAAGVLGLLGPAITGSLAASRAGGNPGGGGDRGDGDRPPVPGKPTLLDARYAGDRVTGRWTAANYAGRYDFQLLSGGNVWRSVDAGGFLSGAIPLRPEELSAGIYHARVVASRGGQGTPSDARPIFKLGRAAVRLTYADGVLTATASGGEGTGYLVQFYGPDDRPLDAPQPVQPAPASVTLTLPLPLGARYGAAAQAVKDRAIPGDFGDRVTLTRLPKPVVGVTQAEEQLSVRWGLMTAAASYTARLLDGGNPWGRPKTGLHGVTTTFDLPSIAAGGRYGVQVRAVTDDQQGDWCEPVTLTTLPTPGAPVLTFDAAGPSVIATWPALTATGVVYHYDFELTDVRPDAPVVPPQTDLSAATATVSAAGGQTYTGRVRARVGESFGPWGPTVQVQTFGSQGEPPRGLSAVSPDGWQVTARWQPVAGARRYVLQAWDNPDAPPSRSFPTKPLPPTIAPPTQLSFPVNHLPVGTVVRLAVRAEGGDAGPGAWSAPVDVTLAARAALFWSFLGARSVGRVSAADGQSLFAWLTGVGSQTGGGPVEDLDQSGLVLLTRQFGTEYPFVEFTTAVPVVLEGLSFQHLHNHTPNVPAAPSYAVQLQLLSTVRGPVPIGRPLTVSKDNSGAHALIDLGQRSLPAGSYRIRWFPLGLAGGATDTVSDYFGLQQIGLHLRAGTA